ncbi:suppressor of white-apricot isoform X4 [Anticarsia gemmatalis]
MYKEEELKRLHAAGYGQVGFNYDAPAEPTPATPPVEIDEPFLPTAAFKALLPVDIVLPESLKQNAIIEKTANFIASQGAQMEILIKAKQRDNPQFQFLGRDSNLHPYYTALIGLVKAGKWPEKKVEVVEEKPPENEEYLHPSLAATVIESAPAIPSIHYKPSADCDYTMLISKMRGEGEGESSVRGDVPPPGTEPPRHTAQISRAPVMYTRGADGNHVDPTAQPAPTPTYTQQYAPYYHQYLAQEQEKLKKQHPAPLKSTGLSLMKNYNTDSDSDVSDFDDSSSTDSKEPAIATPPDDVQIVIDKMAAYVARNGDEFADIVRAKNDPRFTFLEPENVYHPYYRRLMQQKRGDVNGKEKKKKSSGMSPVSFSIKKLKEPDPILPKPALPYESSSDEDPEKHADKQTDKQEEVKETPKVVPFLANNVPPAIVYKIDSQVNNEIPVVKAVEPVKPVVKVTPKPTPVVTPPEVKKEPPKPAKIEEKPPVIEQKPVVQEVEVKVVEPEKKEIVVEEEKERERDRVRDRERERERDREKESSHKREKKKHRDKKKEYRSKSESRDSRRNERRSVEREKKREIREKEERESKRAKYSRDELENEVISLEDNSDDLIDLTGDQSDSKVEETEAERAKQQERRRRAAEFLKKVGVDPSAAQLPTSSLASAMVDTLESLRKKKAEEEEKKRRRDKRRHRDRRDYDDESERSHRKSKRRKYKSSDDNDDSDIDSSKKKKRKKDRKHSSKNKKKRRRENDAEEEDPPLPVNIDLTNTLKELRTSSPTKELGLQDVEESTINFVRQDSSDDELVRVKRKIEREYSEGEWSSDSEGDSKSSASREE